MDEVRAEDLVQKIGQPRKDRAVLVAGVDNLTPLGKVTPVTVDDDGNLHVRADKLEEKLEELLGERQQDPAAWSIADRLRRLEEKLALLESGQAKVTLSGSNLALRQTIVTGAKTVTSTAAEIFAGSSRLAGRHAMVITNVGTDHVYIGASGVTTNNGFPLFPGDTIRIDFNPASNVPVFAVSGGPNVQVRVVELA